MAEAKTGSQPKTAEGLGGYSRHGSPHRRIAGTRTRRKEDFPPAVMSRNILGEKDKPASVVVPNGLEDREGHKHQRGWKVSSRSRRASGTKDSRVPTS
jgi:hypothetical protein